MFFLIRCAFWLTVVFTTIFNTNPPAAPNKAELVPYSAVALKQDAASSAATTALSEKIQNWSTLALRYAWGEATGEATGGCAAASGECASLAERLAAFARQHPFTVAGKSTPEAKLPQAEAAGRRAGPRPAPEIPLPPPRPRLAYDRMARS